MQSQGNQQLRGEGAAALIRLRRKMGREGRARGFGERMVVSVQRQRLSGFMVTTMPRTEYMVLCALKSTWTELEK